MSYWLLGLVAAVVAVIGISTPDDAERDNPNADAGTPGAETNPDPPRQPPTVVEPPTQPPQQQPSPDPNYDPTPEPTAPSGGATGSDPETNDVDADGYVDYNPDPVGDDDNQDVDDLGGFRPDTRTGLIDDDAEDGSGGAVGL